MTKKLNNLCNLYFSQTIKIFFELKYKLLLNSNKSIAFAINYPLNIFITQVEN